MKCPMGKSKVEELRSRLNEAVKEEQAANKKVREKQAAEAVGKYFYTEGKNGDRIYRMVFHVVKTAMYCGTRNHIHVEYIRLFADGSVKGKTQADVHYYLDKMNKEISKQDYENFVQGYRRKMEDLNMEIAFLNA
jgi:hypothetical protein